MSFRLRSVHLALLLAALPGPAHCYDKGQFLNFVLFNLPPEYFARIPLETRPALIQGLSSDPQHARIDYENGYFRYRLAAAEGETGSAVLWLKLLPRDMERAVPYPYAPLVYVHLAKPRATETGKEEFVYVTHVLAWNHRDRTQAWTEVTHEVIPDTVDINSHLPPKRDFIGVRIASRGFSGSSAGRDDLLIWKDWEFHRCRPYPFHDDHRWEAPLEADRLAILAFRPKRNSSENRELAELIAHAALEKDERFRPLLKMQGLKEIPVLEYALAAYQYSLDQSEQALDLILKRVAEEGNGDTNAKWMLSFFDEWDRTLETYHKYRGTDGAAAEANYMFQRQREYFFPENFEKHWADKMNAIRDTK